jgi:hypothetical protein
MEQLKDIRGINYIDSMWPLPIGTQLVLFVLLLLVVGLLFVAYKKYKFFLSWQYKVLKSLQELKQNLDSLSAKELFEQLSYFLRLVLIKEYGHKLAASKSGRSMLVLLEESDPSGFKWSQEGALLTSVPYMPKDKKIDKAIVARLIDATIKFIQVPHVQS